MQTAGGHPGLPRPVLPRPVTGDGEQGVIFHAQRTIVNSNTDDLGTFGLDLGPNVDIALGDAGVINAGVIVGIAGDAKADDVGLLVSLIASF